MLYYQRTQFFFRYFKMRCNIVKNPHHADNNTKTSQQISDAEQKFSEVLSQRGSRRQNSSCRADYDVKSCNTINSNDVIIHADPFPAFSVCCNERGSAQFDDCV